MITGELKGLLSIKIKSRHDGYTDQFNRIFIVKLLVLCSLIMGISWYKESFNCVIMKGKMMSDEFAKSACWIQGVYIYEELEGDIDRVSYYGIPKDPEADGMYPNGVLCRTKSRLSYGLMADCKPMTRKYFLQYQYMTFYVAALAICFYIPYVFHLYGNSDIISLKKTLKSGDCDVNTIANSYFDHRTNSVRQLRLRVAFNIVVKLLYIAANLIAFLGTDKLLNGKFKNYGTKWAKWSQLENTIRHDYKGLRDTPKPGNDILPPFGYCDIYESSKDITLTHGNKHTVLCELSQNVLYQYCFVLIWFTIVAGIIVSCIGLVLQIAEHLITVTCVLRHGNIAQKMYKVLTLRECEYLEFIRRRDIPLYGALIVKLREEKFGHLKKSNGNGNLPYNETPPPGFNEAMSCI